MSHNPRINVGSALLATALLMVTATSAWAKSSDRQQPMTVDAARSDGTFTDDGVTNLYGDVVVIQGTLEVHADTGQIFPKNGEISRGIFTGKPGAQARMKQINDDGTPVDAVADKIDYDVINNIVTLTGNYVVTSPKGSNAGQKMVYNTQTGNMQSGGDGTRVHTVIQPKSKTGTTSAPAATPSNVAAPKTTPSKATPAKPGSK